MNKITSKKLTSVIVTVVTFFLLIFSNQVKVNASSNQTFVVEEHVYSNELLEMAYLLYLPRDYNPDQTYRLIVFMHGAGDIGFDYNRLHNIDYGFITTIKENPLYYRDTIILVPQCPNGYLWVEDSWKSGEYTLTQAPSPASLAAKQLIDKTIIDYNVDTTRMYAVGVSMGGMAVWDMLARYPNFFAAAAPICGSLDTSKIDEYLKTPIFTANDIRDNIVGGTPTMNVANKLKSLGADIVYKQYDTSVRNDSTYHSSWVDAFSLDKSEDNIYNFIFSHQKKMNDNNKSKSIIIYIVLAILITAIASVMIYLLVGKSKLFRCN